jgi:hypothetical protein
VSLPAFNPEFPENPSPAAPEASGGFNVVDDATRKDIARALGKHFDPYEETFGPEVRPYRTTEVRIKAGHNYTIPLGDAPFAATSKYLFINKVKPLKRDRNTLRCQMTLVSIDDDGNETIEESVIHFFKKGEAVFAFGKDIEDHVDKTKIGKRVAAVGVVTIAGIVVEETARRYIKNKK